MLQLPPWQPGVPLAAVQTLPQVPQLATEVVLLKPSSMIPLQSSSFSLQVSIPASPGTQTPATPITQLSTVRLHSPTPQLVWPRFSSVLALQSSSRPLQVSGSGLLASQAELPFSSQLWVPMQMPKAFFASHGTLWP